MDQFKKCQALFEHEKVPDTFETLLTAHKLTLLPAAMRGTASATNVILPLLTIQSAMADSECEADAEAIHAILAGDRERYAELVNKYQAPAMHLAFSLLGNYEDARDISQEAFVNAYQSLGRFRAAAKFSTWFYRIVVNKCKDLYRQRARRPLATVRVGEPDPEAEANGLFVADVHDPAADPGTSLVNRELAQQLSRAIAELPMQQRTVFVLHHLNGLLLEQVATTMGCRLGTVKSHLHRAVKHLRRQLDPHSAERDVLKGKR